jgi:HEAT repeat protein
VLKGRPLSEWVVQLRSGEPSGRLAAATAIGEGGATVRTVGVRALVGAFSDGDEAVRKEAVSAISKIGRPAVPALLESLNDVEVRDEALAALATIGPAATAAVPRLLTILRDTPREPSLKEIEDDPYKALLQTRDVRSDAAGALVKIDPANSETPVLLCGLLTEYWARAPLKALGEAAVPALAGSLTHENPDIRVQAITILAAQRGPRVTPALRDALKNDDAVVRAHAGIALAEAGEKGEAIVSALAQALVSLSEKDDRLKAIRALREIGAPAAAAIPALQEARKKAEEKARSDEGLQRAMAQVSAAMGFGGGFGGPVSDEYSVIREIDLTLAAIQGTGGK